MLATYVFKFLYLLDDSHSWFFYKYHTCHMISSVLCGCIFYVGACLCKQGCACMSVYLEARVQHWMFSSVTLLFKTLSHWNLNSFRCLFSDSPEIRFLCGCWGLNFGHHLAQQAHYWLNALLSPFSLLVSISVLLMACGAGGSSCVLADILGEVFLPILVDFLKYIFLYFCTCLGQFQELHTGWLSG